MVPFDHTILTGWAPTNPWPMFSFSVCRARSDEDVVMDPLELLGKRMDFQIGLVRCLGIKWLKEGMGRGIQMGYGPALRSRVHTLPPRGPWWEAILPQGSNMSVP